MGRLSSVLLTGVGVLVAAFIVLSVVGALVGFALSVVAVVLSLLVSLAVLGVVALAAVGLFSVVSDRAATADGTCVSRRSAEQPDPDALRDRYVAGDIDDEEFERELERVLDPADRRDGTGTDRSFARGAASDRRLRDR